MPDVMPGLGICILPVQWYNYVEDPQEGESCFIDMPDPGRRHGFPDVSASLCVNGITGSLYRPGERILPVDEVSYVWIYETLPLVCPLHDSHLVSFILFYGRC